MLQRQSKKFPAVTNYLDFLALSWEGKHHHIAKSFPKPAWIGFAGGRTARSMLIKLIPFQVAVAAISTYALLWGRDRWFLKSLFLEHHSKPEDIASSSRLPCPEFFHFRIFDTLDADPDFAREVLIEVQSKPSLKQRMLDFLHGIPILGDITGNASPESERVRVNW